MELQRKPVSRTVSYASALLIVLIIGHGAGAAHAQGQDEEQELRAQAQQLSEKIDSLRSEQRMLLLRKTLYSADSKYLELDLRAGEGSLRYRTRVLRTFRFTLRGKTPDPGKDGAILALTSKADGASARRRLYFDNAVLVIEGKNYRGVHGGNSLFISMSRRDLAAVYYALEAGSFAYFGEQ